MDAWQGATYLFRPNLPRLGCYFFGIVVMNDAWLLLVLGSGVAVLDTWPTTAMLPPGPVSGNTRGNGRVRLGADSRLSSGPENRLSVAGYGS